MIQSSIGTVVLVGYELLAWYSSYSICLLLPRRVEAFFSQQHQKGLQFYDYF
jgi:hypothetical protein